MRAGALVALIGLVLATGATASAHEERKLGPLRVTVGWLDEPAFAGSENAVQVVAEHRGGTPARKVDLQAEVFFGEADSGESSGPLEILPVVGSPGEFRAFLIPTRSGTFTFHISGTIEGRRVDELFTSGESFDDVVNPAEAQFPVQDPTAGELAARLERVDARLRSLQRDIRQLGSEQGGPVLEVVAIVLAAAALGVATLGRPRRRAP